VKRYLLVYLVIAALTSTAQPGALDLSFNPGSAANNEVLGIALQPDGKVLMVGNFNAYNGTYSNGIARVNSYGKLDTTFRTGTGFPGLPRVVVMQPDGQILVGGDFQTYDTTASKGLVRLNSDGSIDTSLQVGTGFNDRVYAVDLQPDGKIVVGGLFTEYNGNTCKRLVRLFANGDIDTSFDTYLGANASVEDLHVLPTGKIIIAGDFTGFWGDPTLRIARVNADGSRDSSFTALPGASAVIFAAEPQPNGGIIVGGNFNFYDAQPHSKIAKVLDTGGNDPGFVAGTGANSPVGDIQLLDNGDIFFAGGFTAFQGRTVNRLALTNNTGTLDTAFNRYGTGADEAINALALQPNGKLLIAGSFTYYNGITRNRIARLYNCLTPQPDSIYGSTYALCSGTPQTYSVTPISGVTKYEWTLPAGWLGSSDSASITATGNGTGGTISVKAFTDSCGYSYVTSRTIATIKPMGVDICLVTVDSASTHNIIIWEKPITALIDSFCIYRETTTNVYTKIADVPYDSLSEYHDYAANPNVTSYRYKLSVIDTCGAESELSPYHNTIHFQNLGSGNFQWTFYQIENAANPVLSFNIYRDNLGNGNFFAIGNVPGTNSTFFDNTFNSFNNSEYVVDVDWSISCTPTRAVNTTRSNKRPKGIIDIQGVINQPDMLQQIQVYPNPASQMLYLNYPEQLTVVQWQIVKRIGSGDVE
jgi:uncharacterized delta-60 repeat protein